MHVGKISFGIKGDGSTACIKTFSLALQALVQRSLSNCERKVKTVFLKQTMQCTLLLAALLLTACATPAAKDFGGSWKPVNHFQDAPTEIPLNPAYTYYASPMDETLRSMLRRWAKDSGMQFSYQLQSDYTLYKSVAKIRTTDIYAATTELSSIYAAQGVSVSTDGREIAVRQADSHAPKNTASNHTP